MKPDPENPSSLGEQLDQVFTRPSGRAPDQLREVRLEPGIAPHADGSVLASFGDTQVICAAMIEDKVPRWMQRQKVPGGWLTAEYNMLPYSTLTRKDRPISRGRQEGRNIEIQRLVGRSLRAVLDLGKLPGKTLWIDCDVLRADGGTRTASITGAWLATRLAVNSLLADGKLKEDPILDHLAAISVGVYRNHCLLDLDYPEDRDASVDANIVMTGSGHFVEIQSSGEESTYTRAQLDELLALAEKGVSELVAAQRGVLEQHS
ncbi:MAG: ribonuclease PH [Opitutales bacterium]